MLRLATMPRAGEAHAPVRGGLVSRPQLGHVVSSMNAGHSAATSRAGSHSSGFMSRWLTDSSQLKDFRWTHGPIRARVQNTSAPGLSNDSSGVLNCGTRDPLTRRNPARPELPHACLAGRVKAVVLPVSTPASGRRSLCLKLMLTARFPPGLTAERVVRRRLPPGLTGPPRDGPGE